MTRLMCLAVMLFGLNAARAFDFEVDCRLGKGDPQGDRAAGTLKVIAAPKLATKGGECAGLLVGGHIPIGAEMVPVGTEVLVTPTRVDGGGVRIRVVLKVHSSTGGAAPQVTTVAEEATATIQPGGTVRVEIGKDPKNLQWVDVTVLNVK